MKKLIIIGLSATLLLAGCQNTQDIETTSAEPVVVEPATEEEKIVLNEESEQVSEEMADVMEEAVVSELHEWTEADAAKLKEFTDAADKLELEEAKLLLEGKISDASNMMADEYVAYYEERLISELNKVSDMFFVGTIQEDLSSEFNYGYFSRSQLQDIKAIDTIEKIDPLYDIGYKVETSEGMYYPIVDYSVLYKYEDKVTTGVQKYLRLMKRQSDIMAYSDAAVVVPWSELGERLLMAEALQDMHLPKGMKERAEMEYKWNFMTFVFGTNNTPVFDYENKTITDPEILSAFKEVGEKGGNHVKRIMTPYLEILEEEDYVGTDKVYETINALLKDELNI
jgi:hypothetical protein